MKIEKYHTAVGKYKESNSKTVHEKIYNFDGNIVFQHDICKGNHEMFNICDCICSEISWKNGYEKFTTNTSAENTSYNDYIKAISCTIERLNKPTFILCGEQVFKMLKKARKHKVKLTKHNNYETCYAVYNFDEEITATTEIELNEFVAEKFSYILDFSCGFGNILNSTIKKDKKVVLCDINYDCVEYIKNKFSEVKND